MSAISNYTTSVNAQFDIIADAVGALTTAISGIADDVVFLKDTIAEIQNGQGAITPEDQALLDSIEARAATLAINLGALKTVATQLDAATQRPAPPPE